MELFYLLIKRIPSDLYEHLHIVIAILLKIADVIKSLFIAFTNKSVAKVCVFNDLSAEIVSYC